MYCITILLITILIPIVHTIQPKIRLTFTPDEKYMTLREQLEIKCDIINATNEGETAQLWYVHLETGQRTAVSRKLLTSPTKDDPAVFRNNKNHRYLYESKNHIRIKDLHEEDSARYECDCPDCEATVIAQTRQLYVMKTATPKWIIESMLPLHENTKTIIKCQVENFYPYVTHKILRNHLDITNLGSSSLTNNNSFPQKFTWEATVTPTYEWHNSTIQCIVTQGKVDEQASKVLDVLFGPRFNKCEENQYVDMKKNLSTIECAYSGNPQPNLLWLRQSDKKPITSDVGITVQVKNETNGKYRSIVTFEQQKLINISTISKTNGQTNKSENNYFEQLLNDGFIVQLNVNGNDKGRRLIKIVRDENQIRSLTVNKSTTISYSSILLLSFLLILHMLQR